MVRAVLGGEPRTVGIVTGGHFLSHFYWLVLPPLFPMLRADLGLSNAQLGLTLSAISFATLLQIPFGELVDRIGAKAVFVFGVGITGLGITLAGLSGSYLALLAFVLLSGIGQATFHPADYPLLEAVSDDGGQGRSFSVHTFGGYVGFAVAPIVAGAIGVRYGWRTALVALGTVGIGYAVFAALTLRPVYRQRMDELAASDSEPGGSSIGALLRPGILFMFVFFFLMTFASKGVQSFTPILALDGLALSEAVGNTALSAFFAMTAIGVLVGGPLADRRDPTRVIPVFLTIAAAGIWLTVSGFVPVGSVALVGLFAAIGGAFGLVFPSRDRLVSDLSADGSTGRSFGFVFTGTAISGMASPFLLGSVIDLASVPLAFRFIAVFFLAAGLLALLLGIRLGTATSVPSSAD